MSRSLNVRCFRPVTIKVEKLSRIATDSLQRLINIDPCNKIELDVFIENNIKTENIILREDDVYSYAVRGQENLGGMILYNMALDTVTPEYLFTIHKINHKDPVGFMVDLSIIVAASSIFESGNVEDYEETLCIGRDFITVEELFSLRSSSIEDIEVAAKNFMMHIPLRVR